MVLKTGFYAFLSANEVCIKFCSIIYLGLIFGEIGLPIINSIYVQSLAHLMASLKVSFFQIKGWDFGRCTFHFSCKQYLTVFLPAPPEACWQSFEMGCALAKNIPGLTKTGRRSTDSWEALISKSVENFVLPFELETGCQSHFRFRSCAGKHYRVGRNG
jgi:hypothetical protein